MVHGHETENWFLTAPETVVGVRGGHRGLGFVRSGRWPQTSRLRWLGFGIVVALSHLGWLRRSK